MSMHVGDSSSQGPTPNRWISESDRSRSDDAESIDEAHRNKTSQCGDGFLRTFSSRNAEASLTASRAVPPARFCFAARARPAAARGDHTAPGSAAPRPRRPRTTLLTHKLRVTSKKPSFVWTLPTHTAMPPS